MQSERRYDHYLFPRLYFCIHVCGHVASALSIALLREADASRRHALDEALKQAA